MHRSPRHNERRDSRQARRGFIGFVLTGVFALSLAAGVLRGAEPQFSEYQVKGAFLTKFAMFVEWPDKAFQDKQTPLVIGIMGDDPFGPQYEAALLKENAGGRSFTLKRLKSAAEAADCHILFISASESGRLPEILEAVRGKPTLTVGDQEEFGQRGGMVNFFKENGKLRFEVNSTAVQAAGLKMSSKLLQVARPVAPGPVKGDW